MEHINRDEIDGRVHLSAEDGFVITNGSTINGYYVILAVGSDETSIYAITQAEYDEIVRAEEERLLREQEVEHEEM